MSNELFVEQNLFVVATGLFGGRELCTTNLSSDEAPNAGIRQQQRE